MYKPMTSEDITNKPLSYPLCLKYKWDQNQFKKQNERKKKGRKAGKREKERQEGGRVEGKEDKENQKKET